MSAQQSSQLLPGLFDKVAEDQRINVLHIGPALPETVDFFAGYRCKLFFNDLFAELPLAPEPEEEVTAQERIEKLLAIPPGVRFDLCLFWDIFNYLDEQSVKALIHCLRRCLPPGAMAHAFGVRNARTPQQANLYSILSTDQLHLRPRPEPLPGYAPHPQAQLQNLLQGFTVQRSVLLSEGRLEMLLRAGS